MIRKPARRMLPGGMPAKRWCDVPFTGNGDDTCGLALPCPEHSHPRPAPAYGTALD